MSDKASRNDPCPCGSGRKYKQCHGRPQPGAEVLYIHPSKQPVDLVVPPGATPGRPYGLIPVGVPAMVALLGQHGIRVRGVNYPLERSLDPSFSLGAWLRGQRAARLALIDLHWYEHALGALSVARTVKAVRPDVQTVLGGLTASAYAREILADHPEVDWVIRGDAEAPMLQLARQLQRSSARQGEPDLTGIPNLTYRLNGELRENPLSYCASPAELDALDYADLGFLEHADAYYAHEYLVVDVARAREAFATKPFRGRWIATARGCRHECSYCGGCASAQRILAGRNGFVPRAPEAVLGDLAWLAERGIEQASLSIDICELGPAYWQALLGGLREAGIRIGLYNEQFQLPDEAFVDAFARSVDLEHSCLALSPLSGSEEVRRLNGKGYSNAALFDALDALGRLNVPTVVYFSLNLPGEDAETLRETVALAERIYEFFPPSLLKILNSCHTVDPLAPMAEHPERYGVAVETRTFGDYVAYCERTLYLEDAARSEAHRGFVPVGAASRTLTAMADAWDAAREGREGSWWPIPPGW